MFIACEPSSQYYTIVYAPSFVSTFAHNANAASVTLTHI
jgi:hypothetical protein